jgi:uncharacterized membrane protein
MSDPELVIASAAAAGCGLTGGVFFAFSTFVIDGLDRATPSTAIEAMQTINRAAPKLPFMLLFLGTGLLSVLVAGLAATSLSDAASWLRLAGAVSYLLGSLAVTIRFNVPLNDRLDEVSGTDPRADRHWKGYLRPWRRWNHVRTLSSTAACLALIASLTI